MVRKYSAAEVEDLIDLHVKREGKPKNELMAVLAFDAQLTARLDCREYIYSEVQRLIEAEYDANRHWYDMSESIYASVKPRKSGGNYATALGRSILRRRLLDDLKDAARALTNVDTFTVKGLRAYAETLDRYIALSGGLTDMQKIRSVSAKLKEYHAAIINFYRTAFTA